MRITPEEYGMKLVGEIVLNEKAISKSNSKSRWLEKRFKEFEDRIILACRKLPKAEITEQGWVILEAHFKKRIHTDINNLFKSVCDGLVKAKVFKDDKVVAVTGLPPVYDGKDLTIIRIYK